MMKRRHWAFRRFQAANVEVGRGTSSGVVRRSTTLALRKLAEVVSRTEGAEAHVDFRLSGCPGRVGERAPGEPVQSVRARAPPRVRVQVLKKESWPASGERGGGLAPWSRRAISWASVMAAMTRSCPPHRLHTETSIENTLANNEAHPRRALVRGAVCDNEDECHGWRPVASNWVRASLAAPRRP